MYCEEVRGESASMVQSERKLSNAAHCKEFPWIMEIITSQIFHFLPR